MNPAVPSPRPEADVVIDEALVRSLVNDQFEHLAGLSLRFADDGWDNAIYRLGPDLAVRMPRRAAAHVLLLNEVRWLPFLAPRLPLPVPVPVHRGKPAADYPYHWAIVPWLGGEHGAGIGPEARDGYAIELAGFLRALHVPAPADAPRNPVLGVPLRERDQAVREGLQGHPARQRARCWRSGKKAWPRHHIPARGCGCTGIRTRRTCLSGRKHEARQPGTVLPPVWARPG